jgi:hypothetical protein
MANQGVLEAAEILTNLVSGPLLTLEGTAGIVQEE